MSRKITAIVIALIIGAVGGALFAVLHVPLAWTLGAIFTSALAAVAGNRWPMPRELRSFARPVVGVLAGSAFTSDTISMFTQWWPALFVVAAYSLVISAIGFVGFRRLFGFDTATAYFAATPGGLSELTLIGGTLGADMKRLLVIQLVRVLAVVVTMSLVMPLLGAGTAVTPLHVPGVASGPGAQDWAILIAVGVAGFLIARRIPFPGAILIAPMLLSAVVHITGLTSATVPPWLVAFVQVLIGSIVGSRFVGITFAELRRSIAIASLWAAFMISTAAAVAIAASMALHLEQASFLLAMAPGGTAEILVITFAVGADVAFVAFCQICRVFLVISLAPVIFQWLPAPPGAREMADRD